MTYHAIARSRTKPHPGYMGICIDGWLFVF